jgi:hypothetical protein
MGLSFTIATDPRQRSHSQVRVPRGPLLYFTVSDSRLSQPVGPGPHIYIPQEQGGPFIPPGTGFPFHRLLRLAGLRWRYSTPPPHGIIKTKLKLKLESHCDWRSVSKSWYRAPSGAHDQIFISVWQLLSSFRGAPSLTRGRVCLLYVPLALANAVFLGSLSLGTCDHILLSQIWDFPFRLIIKTEFLLHYIYKLNSYLKGNTLHLRYKVQHVHAA